MDKIRKFKWDYRSFKIAFRYGWILLLDLIVFIPMRLLIGPKIWTKRVWPPKNYQRYNPLYFWFVERPLADRGVFLPKRSPKDGSRFKTFNNEHKIIDGLVRSLSANINKYFVDIGAGDGIEMSNTYLLAANGWSGLSVEIDESRFAAMAITYQRLPNVNLVRCRVTPTSVIDLLGYSGAPKNFGVLNIDIDGYDYYVLKNILREYRPQVIVAEINPAIPASVYFSINFSEAFLWSGNSWFQGMSLAMLKSLADSNNYKIVDVNDCAAFLMPMEISGSFLQRDLKELDKLIVSKRSDIDAVLRNELNLSPTKALGHVSNTLFKGQDLTKCFVDIKPLPSNVGHR